MCCGFGTEKSVCSCSATSLSLGVLNLNWSSGSDMNANSFDSGPFFCGCIGVFDSAWVVTVFTGVSGFCSPHTGVSGFCSKRALLLGLECRFWICCLPSQVSRNGFLTKSRNSEVGTSISSP